MIAKCKDCGNELPVNHRATNLIDMSVAVHCTMCNRPTPHELLTRPAKKSPHHPAVDEACEQIDAAIFSGDAGGPEGVEKLKQMCERWLRGLKEFEDSFKEAEDEEEDDESICPMCGENPLEYEDQKGICSECNTCPECEVNQIEDGHFCKECYEKAEAKINDEQL